MRTIVVLAVVFGLIAFLGGPTADLRGFVDNLPVMPAPIEGLLPRSTATAVAPATPTPLAAAPEPGQQLTPAVSRETVMTEEEVNRRMSEAIASGVPVPVQNLSVRLRGNNLIDFTGKANLAGVTADLAATVVLISSNGQGTIDVRSAQAGPFPVPSGLVSPLVHQALSALGASGPDASRLPDGIDRVDVRPGALVLIHR
ncbi:MAG: hypothetical protein EXR52_08690 [Dehalococcoidia bacterium]|nr:hypothetical protein [Dehalococcoidia bacterium]